MRIQVFSTKNALDAIIIKQTNGCEYDIFPKDVINKLKFWQKISNFEIISAYNTGLNLQFTSLPKDIEDFAQDVYEFCPDVQNPKEVIKQITKSKTLYLSWD